MKLLEVITPNAYFEVLKDLKVWVSTGFKPTNNYAGQSRIHSQAFEEQTLKAGNMIEWLHGGLFWKDKSGTRTHMRLDPPGDKSPFEKNYGPHHDNRGSKLESLVKSGHLRQAKVSEGMTDPRLLNFTVDDSDPDDIEVQARVRALDVKVAKKFVQTDSGFKTLLGKNGISGPLDPTDADIEHRGHGEFMFTWLV